MCVKCGASFKMEHTLNSHLKLRHDEHMDEKFKVTSWDCISYLTSVNFGLFFRKFEDLFHAICVWLWSHAGKWKLTLRKLICSRLLDGTLARYSHKLNFSQSLLKQNLQSGFDLFLMSFSFVFIKKFHFSLGVMEFTYPVAKYFSFSHVIFLIIW